MHAASGKPSQGWPPLELVLVLLELLVPLELVLVPLELVLVVEVVEPVPAPPPPGSTIALPLHEKTSDKPATTPSRPTKATLVLKLMSPWCPDSPCRSSLTRRR